MLNTTFRKEPKCGPFRLNKINDGLYQIHSKTSAYEGVKELIWSISEDMGIHSFELDFAVSEMTRLAHDSADFDVNGVFLRTTDSAERKIA